MQGGFEIDTSWMTLTCHLRARAHETHPPFDAVLVVVLDNQGRGPVFPTPSAGLRCTTRRLVIIPEEGLKLPAP